MLKIVVPASEWFDEKNNEFITVKQQNILLEHSLVSISRWESKWHKPFLDKKQKTTEENMDYFRCMTISKGVDDNIYKMLPKNVVHEIYQYINDPMTGRKFREIKETPRKEIVTSELIYFWMISLGIPFECEKWHFNRLMALIRVCSMKSQGPKKMSKSAWRSEVTKASRIEKHR